MCTAISHAVAGIAIARTGMARPLPWKFWFAVASCAAIPDLDVALHSYGVKANDLWGHRGITHSLCFALVLALVVTLVFLRRSAPPLSRRFFAYVACLFAATASQGVLDAMTNGGSGVMFFAPFDTTRRFFPWRPIPVAHFGIASLFTEYGAHVLLSEMFMVWLPLGTVALISTLVRRKWFGAGAAHPSRSDVINPDR